MATTKKKPTAKSAATRKTAAPALQKPAMRSFVLSKDTPPFFTFRVTHQTVYWAILSILILILGVWVIMLNVKIQNIYDQLQPSDTTSTSVIKHKQ